MHTNSSNPVVNGYSIFFPAYFLFLYLYIHPDWLYYAIVNTRDEPFPIFLTGKAFFLFQCGSAGGVSDYFSALFSQSYSVSWLGSAATTLLSAGIYFILRRSIEMNRGPSAPIFLYLPALISLCMINRYELPIPLLTNSLIALSCVLLYDAFASRFRTTRYWLFPLVCAGVFFMTGRGVLLFAVVTAMRTLRTNAPSSGKKVFPPLPSLLATGLVLSIVICFFPAVFAENSGPLPLYYSFSTGHLRMYWYDCAFLASTGLCLALPTIFKKPLLRVPGLILSPKVSSGMGIAIAVLCLYFSHSDWIRNHMRLEYLTHKNQWNDVLTFVNKLHPKDLDVVTVYDVNSALYHTGRLASDMFRYPQSIPALILPVAFEKSPVPLGLRKALFYFELGEVNIAQQKLYEVYETASEHPLVLNGLAETHSVKRQNAAAKVVYARLAQDLVYGNHAKAMLQTLEKDPAYDGNDRLKKIRLLFPENDSVRNAVDVVAICQELLDYNKHNRMAFEYLMALYLLAGDLESFAKNIDRAKDFGYASLPTHWSEALALYIDLIKSNDRHLRERAGEESFRQLTHFKEAFIGMHKEWDLRKLREYGADSQDCKRLRPVFGTTYFYYFFFQQSGLS